MKLEILTVPVSDVDRAKAFYTDVLSFNCDHDTVISENMRAVQLTPPGSDCSIAIELVGRGLKASEVTDFGGGVRFVFFKDPNGNAWALQEIAANAHKPDDLDEAKMRELMGNS